MLGSSGGMSQAPLPRILLHLGVIDIVTRSDDFLLELRSVLGRHPPKAPGAEHLARFVWLL
jgi:hypothetical protein